MKKSFDELTKNYMEKQINKVQKLCDSTGTPYKRTDYAISILCDDGITEKFLVVGNPILSGAGLFEFSSTMYNISKVCLKISDINKIILGSIR